MHDDKETATDRVESTDEDIAARAIHAGKLHAGHGAVVLDIGAKSAELGALNLKLARDGHVSQATAF